MPEHQLVFFSNRRQSVTLQDNTNGLSIFSRLMHQPTTAAQGCQFLTREPAREITRLTASAVSDSKRSVAKKKTHTHIPVPFAWQAWDNVHCQGVGCTPWRPSGVPGSPPLLRGRRGTMCTAKGLDVRAGVPLASLGLRFFCVAGVGQCALPRGRMYALASLWRPWVSASFAWQAWDNLHCQGVGCTPWRPSGVPGSPPLLRGRRGTMCTAKGLDVRAGVPLASLGLRLFCVAGVGQCALPRGRMYALASLWRPWVCLFCVAGVGQCALLVAGVGHCAHTHSHSLTLTHSLIHSFTHSLIHSLIHSLTHSHSLTLTHSLTHSHSLPHSHSLTHSLTHSHSLPHSLTPSLPHSLTA